VPGNVERSVDGALLRALADLFRLETVAEKEPQRIQHDGFSRTGFSGEHIQPLVEVEAQIFDEDKILNADFGLFFYLTRQASGGVINSVDVIDTYVYNALRNSTDLGQPAAAGLFQSVVGFILVLSTNQIIRKVDPERALF